MVVVDTFGDLLHRCRTGAGLTQEELAERSGLTARAIRDMERGRSARPYPRSVRSLADALELPADAHARLLTAGRAGSAAAQACGTGPASAARHRDSPQQPAIMPRQLPAAVRHFTGRTVELSTLAGYLHRAAGPAADSAAGPAAGRSAAALIAAIGGTAGVGKTTLAVQWAHMIAGSFPHGQLYVNLRGFDPSGAPLSPATAIRDFLSALDVPSARMPAGMDAQTALYRSLLADRRMLLLLDNARDAEQVRPLLPGPGSLVIVTSRNPLSSLVAGQGACPLTLGMLSAAEARDLLTSFLGPERMAAEPQAAGKVAELCVRLPLALSIAAARAAAHACFPLADLAAELSNMPERLDRLDAGEVTADVRSALSWSYQKLSAPSARMFRLLGVHPGPDVSTAAAASLAGIAEPGARRLLGELTRVNLITEHAAGRYAFHDLLRAYAVELAALQESATDHRAATRRALDHYLHTGGRAATLVRPSMELPGLIPAGPGVLPEPLASRPAALAWLEAEYRVLLRTVEHAAATGFDTHAWQLPWVIADFLDRRGYWHDWAATQRSALGAACRLRDPAGQAYAHRQISRASLRLASYDEALAHLLQALSLREQLGDWAGEASIRFDIGHVFERQARYADALGYVEQGLELYRAGGHRVGESHGLNIVGWLHALQGDYHQAIAYCRQALGLSRELGNRECEADTWDSLGYAHHHLGHYSQAVGCYQAADALYATLGHRYCHAVSLVRFGEAYVAYGRVRQGRNCWAQALAILDELHHAEADQVRALLKGLQGGKQDRPAARRRGQAAAGQADSQAGQQHWSR